LFTSKLKNIFFLSSQWMWNKNNSSSQLELNSFDSILIEFVYFSELKQIFGQMKTEFRQMKTELETNLTSEFNRHFGQMRTELEVNITH
jgi:hypothetical protein